MTSAKCIATVLSEAAQSPEAVALKEAYEAVRNIEQVKIGRVFHFMMLKAKIGQLFRMEKYSELVAMLEPDSPEVAGVLTDRHK